MSIIFGTCRPAYDPGLGRDLQELAAATQRYALDGTFLKTTRRVGMGFQPYYTDEHTSLEKQPLVDHANNMLVFDGRLDNRDDLCAQMNLRDTTIPSSSIVLAAFQHWGRNCFSRFVGDWALALWIENEDTLYLARDHAGTRNLFYEIDDGSITWGTCLETFLVDERVRDLDREYARRYLAAEPTRDLTPYSGIRSVVPAHSLRVRDGALHPLQHWSARIDDRIELPNDEEYAERFLHLFRQAVARRTGAGAPILAELSGGMDSSGIVCISDEMRLSHGATPRELLDTISFYDDSEPDWNERPFFTAVEKQRAKAGFHIDVSTIGESYEAPDARYLLPGADASGLRKEEALEDVIQHGNYRIIVSGMGGDELLGGPPNALPELADYLVAGRLQTLIKQALAWSLASRSPLIYTLKSTVSFAKSLYTKRGPQSTSAPSWVVTASQRYSQPFEPAEIREGCFCSLPSSLDNCYTWWSMLETLPHRFPRLLQRREYRYPYLDRDLVDFLLRVPRSRLLKPGRRRFLMRNALRDLVPTEVLERRRKAFVMRRPMNRFSDRRQNIASLFEESELSKANLVDLSVFQRALREVSSEVLEMSLASMLRTIYLELWLKSARVSSDSEILPCINRRSSSAR